MMKTEWAVLVVSSQIEGRRTLTRILEGLPIDITSVCNLAQASEALSKRRMALIFCDEVLPDGTYRDLLSRQGTPKVVVISPFGDRPDCLEAMRWGAFDVIRSPVQPTDVELAFIHASREKQVA
jgi:DNA-binding NtrC family response regulator